MGSFGDRVMRIFFPNRCVVCDRVIKPGPLTCETCSPKILSYPPGRKAVCEICGFKEKDCTCGKWRYYEKSVFPVYLEGDMRNSINAFKFRGRLDKTKPLSELMFRALTERDMLQNVDCVTFVPMGEKQQKKRGYNQAKELAAALSARAGIPLEELMYKCQDTPSQHDQNAVRRQGNLLGVYEPIEEKIPLIENRRILLVDDIITTGATLNEAAKTLLIFGAKTVSVVAAAGRRRVHPKRKEK